MCEIPREKEGKRRWFTAARCNSRRMRTKTDRAGAQQRKAAEVKKLPRIIFAKKKIIFACPGKIEGWGMCNKACSPQNQAFAFANMNLLTDDECRALTKWVGDRGHKKLSLLRGHVSLIHPQLQLVQFHSVQCQSASFWSLWPIVGSLDPF